MKHLFLILVLWLAGLVSAHAAAPFGFMDAGGSASGGTLPITTFSPLPGSYATTNGHQSVTLFESTSGAHLFYTNNGTTPTHTGDTATGSTIRIGSNSGVVDASGTVTFKVIAYLSGFTDSPVATGTYTITMIPPTPTPTPSSTPTPTPTPGKVTAVTLSPPPGDYELSPPNLTVTMSTTTSGAHLFYRTDGGTPTHSGDTATNGTTRIGSNSGNITITGSKTVKVLGYLAGFTDSDITTGVYNVTLPGSGN